MKEEQTIFTGSTCSRPRGRRVDTTYCGTQHSRARRALSRTSCSAKKRARGLVFGSFGEVSIPAHQLVDSLATSHVSVEAPQRGRMGVEKAIIVGQLCRKLSVASIRAQCISLHGQLELIADQYWVGQGCSSKVSCPGHGSYYGARQGHLPADPPRPSTRGQKGLR